MSFFFAVNSKKSKTGGVPLHVLHELQCTVCPLAKCGAISPDMSPRGDENATVYVLGEAPTTQEDNKGTPFVGKWGDYMRDLFKTFAPDHTYRFNNCVRTAPPDGRDPTREELECCRPSIIADIEATRPKIIIGLGKIPLEWATNSPMIDAWRGKKIPVRIGSHECWFYSAFNPSRIEWMAHDKEYDPEEYENVFLRDMEIALDDAFDPGVPVLLDPSSQEVGIKWSDRGDNANLKQIVKHLEWCAKQDLTAVDIETKNLRPYDKTSKILTVSVGTEDNTLAFPLDHPDAGWSRANHKVIDEAFCTYLYEAEGIKAAHGLRFELEWLTHRYGAELAYSGEWADTMAMGLCMDGRRGALSLDDLCLIYLGFRVKEAYGLDIKNLDLEPLSSVLPYNGSDVKHTAILVPVLMERLKSENLLSVYEDKLRRVQCTAVAQLVGLPVNHKEVNRHSEELEVEVRRITKEIRDDPAIAQYERRFGYFDLASNPCITKLFRDVLDEPAGKRGDKYSTDKEALKLMDHPLAPLISSWRTLTRMKATYIDSLKPETGGAIWPDGLVHTSMDPLVIASGRLNSTDPNMQAYPKHDEQNKTVRSVIGRPGGTVVCIDYGQIDVRSIGMASKDKNLCEFLRTNYDIHEEWGQRIARAYPRIVGGKKFLNDKAVMKKMRQSAKHEFVFPCFNGAQPPSISMALDLPRTITTALVNDFWNMFPDVLAWHDDVRSNYEELGYVATLGGQRRYGPMKTNAIINTPIQGTAAEITMDAMNRLSRHAVTTGQIQRHPNLNIHDDLTFTDITGKTLEEDVDFIIQAMLNCDLDFINVPLSVEVTMGPNWFQQELVGVFFTDTY